MPIGIYIRTEEHKQKISNAMKGKTRGKGAQRGDITHYKSISWH